MSYVVFARRYRPQTFDDVIGQEPVATTLKHAIEKDRVGHAYLFAGPRGVGKTSMARIFAKALNCDKGPTPTPCGKCEHCTRIAEGDDIDVSEIDGASNRGVEDARELRLNVGYAASGSRFKIYIIDEVHMLTNEAFNTLLKTLEEPPPHVKFIFATTEPHKLPETIRSRCQEFAFKPLSVADITRRLEEICKKEKVKADKDVLRAVARAAGGGMRDSQSLLDQVISFSKGAISMEDVETVLGLVPSEKVAEIVEAAHGGDVPAALVVLRAVLDSGADTAQFLSQLIEYLRQLLLAVCGAPPEPGSVPAATFEEQKAYFSADALLYMIQILAAARNRPSGDTLGQVFAEMALVKLCRAGDLQPLGDVLERIEGMERRMASGAPASAPAAPALPAAPSAPPARTARGAPKKAPAPVGDAAGESGSVGGPAEPAAAPASAPSGDILTAARARWQDVIAAVRREAPSVGAFLAEGAPVASDAGMLEVGFPPGCSFQKEQVGDEKRRSVVERCLGELLGGSVRVRCVTVDGSAPAQADAGGPARENRPARREASAPVEPEVRRVVDMFGGMIVD